MVLSSDSFSELEGSIGSQTSTFERNITVKSQSSQEDPKSRETASEVNLYEIKDEEETLENETSPKAEIVAESSTKCDTEKNAGEGSSGQASFEDPFLIKVTHHNELQFFTSHFAQDDLNIDDEIEKLEDIEQQDGFVETDDLIFEGLPRPEELDSQASSFNENRDQKKTEAEKSLELDSAEIQIEKTSNQVLPVSKIPVSFFSFEENVDEKDKKSQACALEVSQEDSGAQIVDFRESYLEKQAESKENLEQSDPDNDDGTPTKESGSSKR